MVRRIYFLRIDFCSEKIPQLFNGVKTTLFVARGGSNRADQFHFVVGPSRQGLAGRPALDTYQIAVHTHGDTVRGGAYLGLTWEYLREFIAWPGDTGPRWRRRV
jgi:hypothetical protein